MIAMAGDEILMGAGTSLMIHNAWGAVVGNANDFITAAETFGTFDGAMLSIYSARTGGDARAIKKMMDAETIMSAEDAVKNGFADSIVNLPAAPAGDRTRASAKRKLEALLAEKGMPRSERRKLFRELSGTQDAADDAKHDAGEWPVAEMQQLLSTITQ